MTEIQQKLEALCEKWIEREREFRNCANEASKVNDSGVYLRYSARGDTLATARRELQECAILVVLPNIL